MLEDINNSEKARLLALLETPPEPIRRADLRKGKAKRLPMKAGMVFDCAECGQQFDADWEMIVAAAPSAEPAGEEPAEKTYLATCPTCQAQAEPARWYRALLKAWERSRNDDELNAERAKNLRHDDEFYKITRFNGYRHGMYAKSKHLFPNKPGSKWCSGCDIDHDYCRSNPSGACIKAAESYMLRHMAVEKGDPSMLNALVALQQANGDMLFNMMTSQLLTDGPAYFKPDIINGEAGPQIARDEDGKPVGMIHAHPLLNYWQKQLALLNMTPYDTATTHRQATPEDSGAALLKHAPEEKAALAKLLDQQAEAMGNLAKLIELSQEEPGDG